ncbi:MAG: proline dehydrogenase family protein [Longimicrobiaceae bacterium]
MLKRSLLFLSENPVARLVVTGSALSRRVAERFVAGDTLDEAVLAARALNDAGLLVSLDYLGEAVSSRAEAEAATEVAIRTLERVRAEKLQANVSLKPTQLGLDLDPGLCRDNVARVLTRARELAPDDPIFVRMDMEASEFTEGTIRLVEELWEAGFRNVGTVLQSYLRRTPEDVERLNQLGARVRLVKGAYQEPEEVAFPDKAEVDRHFVEEMKALLTGGNYPAIATHDEAMIDATRRFAWEKGIGKHSFEFQMLYGVRRDLQSRLREEGYTVRIYVPFGDSWYPYLMRRMAERPANLLFVARNVALEGSDMGRAIPAGAGLGMVAGGIAGWLWRNRRDRR